MPREIAALLLLIPVALLPMAQAGDTPAPGTLELVAELPINPGNLAVTGDGRVFATVHQFRRADAQLIEITGPNTYRPWPNEAWNGDFGSGPDVLNSVLGISIDRKGRLWVIDNGLGDPPQTPKLVAFSLADGTPVFRYDFPPETGPVGSFLNDLGNNAISVLRPDGTLATLVRDDRLIWPDALSFGEPGWLYVAVNQLHRAPMLNAGVEGAEPPFLILRVWTGKQGIPGC